MTSLDNQILDELCRGRLNVGPAGGAVREIVMHLARQGDQSGLRIIAENIGLGRKPSESAQPEGDVPLPFEGDAA